MSDTKEVKIKLKRIYGNVCMLTGTKVKLTYHHCKVKRVDGGKETVDNGALLTERIHCYYLHSVIEKNCPICFNEINLMLQRYKEAIDTGDLDYITWHKENVVPVFSKQLNKPKRRVRK